MLDRLPARNEQLLDLIKEYGDAVEKLDSGAASVYPDIKYKDRTERVRGDRGQVNRHVVTPRFHRAQRARDTRLADSDLVTIAGRGGRCARTARSTARRGPLPGAPARPSSGPTRRITQPKPLSLAVPIRPERREENHRVGQRHDLLGRRSHRGGGDP